MPHIDSARGRRAMLEADIRQLPSTMAKLAYTAGLRSPDSGMYSHPWASSRAEKAEVDQLLRGAHEQAFHVWLEYRLDEQKADLDLYFSALECGKEAAVNTWLNLESYRSLIPASATRGQRELFIIDLEVLLLSLTERGTTGARDRVTFRFPDGPLLTTKEVSKWLGIASRTLRLWAESEYIPGIKVGRQWRFRRSDLQERLKRGKRTSE